jgi:hypothetical protein
MHEGLHAPMVDMVSYVTPLAQRTEMLLTQAFQQVHNTLAGDPLGLCRPPHLMLLGVKCQSWSR